MEALTPVQRVAVIAIGLVLTLIVVMLVLSWISDKIADWLPFLREPSPSTAIPGLLSAPISARSTDVPGDHTASQAAIRFLGAYS
jgi:hypothetical protein